MVINGFHKMSLFPSQIVLKIAVQTVQTNKENKVTNYILAFHYP